MDNLVHMKNGKVFATSKMVADAFGKVHKNVMRDIKRINESQGDFGQLNFEPSKYISIQNKELPCFEMTRDGFAILAMGFSGDKAMEWKIKYMSAFNAMEKTLSNVQPSLESMNEIIKKCETDKDIASECGRNLAAYKKIKNENQMLVQETFNKVQLSLGFSGVTL